MVLIRIRAGCPSGQRLGEVGQAAFRRVVDYGRVGIGLNSMNPSARITDVAPLDVTGAWT